MQLKLAQVPGGRRVGDGRVPGSLGRGAAWCPADMLSLKRPLQVSPSWQFSDWGWRAWPRVTTLGGAALYLSIGFSQEAQQM